MSDMNSVNDRLEAADQDGAYDGKTIGYVVENDDPLGVARIKVKVPNVLDPDQGPIPWCLPSKKSPFGQGPGYGVYGSPKIGSPVRVSFQNGDPHYPVYECDEYLAAHANQKFKDPNTWGYKDPAGNELFVNMTTGAWEWTHQSGNSIKHDGEGNVTLNVVKNSTTTIGGNETATVEGDSTKTVNGSLNFTVQGDAQIAVAGNLDATVGGTANVESAGAMNIKGNPINLN